MIWVCPHVHLRPAIFFKFHMKERCGMDVQTRRDISRMVKGKGKITIE